MMDPNQTLEEAKAAFDAGETSEALERLFDLAAWRAKGGYAPRAGWSAVETLAHWVARMAKWNAELAACESDED